MIKPQLILDIAGVILTNLSPSYWQELAQIADVPYDYLKALFRNEVREDLWTGKISEEEFWKWLNMHCPKVNLQFARNLIDKHLKPLPAFDQLVSWSQLADIHLLSNHRKEWIIPFIKPILPYIKSITISSETGYCKPDLQIYEFVEAHLDIRRNIIYVDDQEKNLIPAKALGWVTLIADAESKWMVEVQRLIEHLQ
jgi:HAD superfamily hydrolase (TIGR01509 family)